jgi:hypothetical protein
MLRCPFFADTIFPALNCPQTRITPEPIPQDSSWICIIPDKRLA